MARNVLILGVIGFPTMSGLLALGLVFATGWPMSAALRQWALVSAFIALSSGFAVGLLATQRSPRRIEIHPNELVIDLGGSSERIPIDDIVSIQMTAGKMLNPRLVVTTRDRRRVFHFVSPELGLSLERFILKRLNGQPGKNAGG